MTDRTPHAAGPDDTAAEEAAARWDARLRAPSCTAADREAFDAWRALDPEHEAAFDRLQHGLKVLHDAYGYDPELRAMRDEALSHPAARRRPTAGLAAGLAAAGVAAVILTCIGAWSFSQGPSPAPAPRLASAPASLYQTGIGERTTVILSDGTRVTLNTRSRLEVRYAAGRRDVTLVDGQALFAVAKDPARPFVVTAGTRQVTALGTTFDVRLDAARVQVTLIEGKVTVAPTRPPAWDAIAPSREALAPGEKLVAANASYRTERSRADLAAETSWRDGRIVFEDTPLPAAVAEMNRYAATPILVGDASLKDIRINGMFRTNQPMSFVGAVTAYFPVDASARADGATVLTARR